MENLATIEQRVKALSERIEAPSGGVTYGYPIGDATPYIEITDQYHWVVSERGSEFSRKSTHDLDELLYWTFHSITFGWPAPLNFAIAAQTKIRDGNASPGRKSCFPDYRPPGQSMRSHTIVKSCGNIRSRMSRKGKPCRRTS